MDHSSLNQQCLNGYFNLIQVGLLSLTESLSEQDWTVKKIVQGLQSFLFINAAEAEKGGSVGK